MVSVPGAESSTRPQQTDVQNPLSSVRLKAQVSSDSGGPAVHETQHANTKSSQKSHVLKLLLLPRTRGGMWSGGEARLCSFCSLKQSAGDSRHLRSLSPGLWQQCLSSRENKCTHSSELESLVRCAEVTDRTGHTRLSGLLHSCL